MDVKGSGSMLSPIYISDDEDAFTHVPSAPFDFTALHALVNPLPEQPTSHKKIKRSKEKNKGAVSEVVPVQSQNPGTKRSVLQKRKRSERTDDDMQPGPSASQLRNPSPIVIDVRSDHKAKTKKGKARAKDHLSPRNARDEATYAIPMLVAGPSTGPSLPMKPTFDYHAPPVMASDVFPPQKRQKTDFASAIHSSEWVKSMSLRGKASKSFKFDQAEGLLPMLDHPHSPPNHRVLRSGHAYVRPSISDTPTTNAPPTQRIGMPPDKDPQGARGSFKVTLSTVFGGDPAHKISDPHVPNPKCTLIMEQLPKTCRTRDWVESWSIHACSIRPKFIAVDPSSGKALVEYVSAASAGRAWDSPKLSPHLSTMASAQLKGRPREDLIRVWWYKGKKLHFGNKEWEEGEIDSDEDVEEVVPAPPPPLPLPPPSSPPSIPAPPLVSATRSYCPPLQSTPHLPSGKSSQKKAKKKAKQASKTGEKLKSNASSSTSRPMLSEPSQPHVDSSSVLLPAPTLPPGAFPPGFFYTNPDISLHSMLTTPWYGFRPESMPELVHRLPRAPLPPQSTFASQWRPGAVNAPPAFDNHPKRIRAGKERALDLGVAEDSSQSSLMFTNMSRASPEPSMAHVLPLALSSLDSPTFAEVSPASPKVSSRTTTSRDFERVQCENPSQEFLTSLEVPPASPEVSSQSPTATHRVMEMELLRPVTPEAEPVSPVDSLMDVDVYVPPVSNGSSQSVNADVEMDLIHPEMSSIPRMSSSLTISSSQISLPDPIPLEPPGLHISVPVVDGPASSTVASSDPAIATSIPPTPSLDIPIVTTPSPPPSEPRAMKNAPKEPSYHKKVLRQKELEERIARSKLELAATSASFSAMDLSEKTPPPAPSVASSPVPMVASPPPISTMASPSSVPIVASSPAHVSPSILTTPVEAMDKNAMEEHLRRLVLASKRKRAPTVTDIPVTFPISSKIPLVSELASPPSVVESERPVSTIAEEETRGPMPPPTPITATQQPSSALSDLTQHPVLSPMAPETPPVDAPTRGAVLPTAPIEPSLDELAVSFITETIQTLKPASQKETMLSKKLELEAKQRFLAQQIAESRKLMEKLSQARTKHEKESILGLMRRISRATEEVEAPPTPVAARQTNPFERMRWPQTAEQSILVLSDDEDEDEDL